MPHKATIFDVAERAGVAISSVSTALNNGSGVSERTRARIVAAADELGFVPSLRGRSLSGRRAYAIGLVVHRDPDVLELDPFFAAFIGGIESAIDARGYALVLQIGSDETEALNRYRRLVADGRVDGVFLSELTVDDPRTQLVQDLGLPAVGINADEGFPLPAVRQDHRTAIDELIQTFVDHGHRRIGHVAGPAHFIHARQRRVAWEQALATRGIRPGPVADGGFTYQGGVDAAAKLLHGDAAPTAVFCANDLAALGFIAQAQRMGLDVPGDVSVAGYDGIRLGQYMRPQLTTILTSPRQLGAGAANILLDLVESRAVADTDVEPAVLDLRDTTADVKR